MRILSSSILASCVLFAAIADINGLHKYAPTSCPEGAQFKLCGKPEECQKTCQQEAPEVCLLSCVRGCFCKGDTIRDETTGKCVSEKYCSRSLTTLAPCMDTEEFKDCGPPPSCQKTCQHEAPEVCTTPCQKGCFCKEGLIRDQYTGHCVLKKDCTDLITPWTPPPAQKKLEDL